MKDAKRDTSNDDRAPTPGAVRYDRKDDDTGRGSEQQL